MLHQLLITLSEYTREALYSGHDVHSLKTSKFGMTFCLHNQVFNHLKSFPWEAKKYAQVEQVQLL